MKPMLLSTALAACLAMPAFAQTANSPFQAEVVEQSVAASDLIGARIYVSEAEVDADAYEGVQTDWNDIGEVNDILLGRDGKVDAVLVDIGGFLGMGERQAAVDMDALRFVQDSATDADDWFLVMRGDRALIENAPEYRRTAAADAPADAAATTETEAQADIAATDSATDPAPAPVETEVDNGAAATDGTTSGYALPEGYALVEPGVLTAEMLTGAQVYGPNNNDIAEIADLVLTPEGKVSQVVMDVGGFLGMGEHRVAIPMERVGVALRDGADVRVYTDLTEEELKALPEFSI